MASSKRTVDWGEAVVPGLTLLFAGAYFLQVMDASWTAIYWPAMIAIVLGILLILLLFTFVFTKKTPKVKQKKTAISWTWHNGRKLSLVFFSSIGYLIAINYLGYSLCNLLYLLFIFRGLGSRKWGINITVALAIALFLYFGLIVFMKMSLPVITVGGLRI